MSADRLSLVLQLAGGAEKGRGEHGGRIDASDRVGPVTARHQAERLNPGSGVPVIAHVALQDVEGVGREALLRARIALQGASRNDVRVVGRGCTSTSPGAAVARLKPAPHEMGRVNAEVLPPAVETK